MQKKQFKYPKKWQLPTFDVFELRAKKHQYCICIPIINEGKKFQKQLESMIPYTKFADIIIADGGSTDDSTNLSFLRKCKVQSLLVKTGAGKLGAQLRMAFAYATIQGYKGIITIDGNGKDGKGAIPEFIKKLDEGYDYIQASRFIKGGRGINTPTLRLLGIRLILSPILSYAAKHIYTDVTNGFRGYSTKYLIHPSVNVFRNTFMTYEILFYLTARANQLGFKTIEIPTIRQYPKGKVPTKIIGLKKNLALITDCLKVLRGDYNPLK